MKIGLLSDTHGVISEKVFHHFREVDEIWHAGDIGDMAALDKLEAFKPVKGVFGNIDGPELRQRLPEDLWMNVNGLEVFMTHIAGYPPKYNKRINQILKEKHAALLVCGHSHILKVMTDPTHNNMLYINPGAAGNQGFHKVKTLVRFSILEGKVANLQVIEIGSRV